ncbi:MAG: protein-L-isoaspartate(D-aspartate) O-methyltransferase [Candidatus Obscuribacterales bacterium]|nr:protein-L-isoaspartate(D-aspartate) O-methyltransferase [Candidatus Obscuribacterales bacterium]
MIKGKWCTLFVRRRQVAVRTVVVAGLATVLTSCGAHRAQDSANDEFTEMRKQMVARQIVAREVSDKRVILAMEQVPRHHFVPSEVQAQSYEDYPLPIGMDQTISQPYIVAFMCEQLKLKPGEKVLEIGTGSGYQAAVLSKLAKDVYSIEILEAMGKRAADTLRELGYANVHARIGDGYAGWPEEAPFDAIVVTAAPDHIPRALIDQLAPGGRLLVPVGKNLQSLERVTKDSAGKVSRETLLPVRFVPMTGAALNKPSATTGKQDSE